MTARIYNGQRVTVLHPSAAPDLRGALVETPDKTTLAWFLTEKRAALPMGGETIEFSPQRGQVVMATVVAIARTDKPPMAEALIELMGAGNGGA